MGPPFVALSKHQQEPVRGPDPERNPELRERASAVYGI
jgi:hypothetical protein